MGTLTIEGPNLMSNQQDKAAEAKTEGFASLLQKYLPLLLSVIAVVMTGVAQFQRTTEARSSYNQSRIELFKQIVARPTGKDEIMNIYREVFPNDAKSLEGERAPK